MENVPIIIGIAGGTASGKSTFARNIDLKYKDKLTILSHDYYYKNRPDLTFEERTKINYDHPNAFDTDLLIEHLKLLKNGQSIEHPVYSYTTHLRENYTERSNPSRVMIVEGILIFENKELRDLMDIKIFIDADSDIRLSRRIIRDVETRGRSLNSVLEQYFTTVKPMHEQFVEPSKKFSDIIVPQGGENIVALNMVFEQINSILGIKGI